MRNFFSYQVDNEFIDHKKTEVAVNYCGRRIGTAFFYLDDVYIDFEGQPMIPSLEWHFLETILKQIKRRFPNSTIE